MGKTTLIFSKLSSIQRRLLIRHIEGPQPIHRTGTGARGVSTADCLTNAGFLRGHPVGARPARLTELTEMGRTAVARILSEYAEALIAVGCLEIDSTIPNDKRPIRMLARMKHKRQVILESDPRAALGAEIAGLPAEKA
jgi:hypothetical protein